MRCAACRLNWSQLRALEGDPSEPPEAPDVDDFHGAGDCGDEQAASIRAVSSCMARFLKRLRTVQGTIDLLGQFPRDAVDAGQVVHARRAHAADAAEALQQPGSLLRAHARDLFQFAAAGAHARAPGSHAGDRKAVGLVADLGHEHQRGRIMPEIDLGAPVGEHELFQADLAALAFLDAHDDGQIEAELLEHLTRHRHLSATAIHQHKVWHARRAGGHALGDLRIAAR
jgi:hypothetical protein